MELVNQDINCIASLVQKAKYGTGLGTVDSSPQEAFGMKFSVFPLETEHIFEWCDMELFQFSDLAQIRGLDLNPSRRVDTQTAL